MLKRPRRIINRQSALAITYQVLLLLHLIRTNSCCISYDVDKGETLISTTYFWNIALSKKVVLVDSR